jgi:hypothetical protein
VLHEQHAIRDFIGAVVLPPPPRVRRSVGPTSAEIMASLPQTIVAGSNLIAFDEATSATVRSAVSDALLLAQLAADAAKDTVRTPVEWYAKHREVLGNLGWREAAYSQVEEKFSSNDAVVHKAIIPFLTVAFGAAAAAGSLIIEALNQLSEMDKKSNWMTLYNRKSKRLGVTDLQFTAVERQGDDITAKLVGAVLSGDYGKTQVLFFQFKSGEADFRLVRGSFSTPENSLALIEEKLRAKLDKFIPAFIAEVDIGSG